MTREEAIKILYQYTLLDITYPQEDIEAFEFALKELEELEQKQKELEQKQKTGHWIEGRSKKKSTTHHLKVMGL